MGEKRISAEAIWNLPRVTTPVVDSVSGALYYSVRTFEPGGEREGREQIFRLDLKSGKRRPLTRSAGRSSQPAVSPDGKWLAFVRKIREREKPQLHLLSLEGGEAECVTHLPLGVADPRWLPDGSGVLFLAPVLCSALDVEETRRSVEARRKDPVQAHVTEDRLYRFWDRWLTQGEVHHIFKWDLETKELTDLTPDSRRWFDFMDPTGSFDVSPEGTHLAFSADCSEPPHFRIRSAIFEVGLADGVTTLLTADHPGPDVRPRYSPCGRYLLYGTRKQWDFYADRVRLVRRDRKTGKERVLNPDWILSPSEWVWSADSRVYCAVEDDGRTSILRISDGGTERLTHGGVLSGLALAGERIYFQHSTLSAPPEIASCPRDGGEVERMTNHTDGDMQQLDLGPVVDERFPGADGKDVQTFIVYPPDFDPRQKYPLVHLIHGGPHGIFGDAFNFRWNPHPIAAAGYVVAMVNFHGSTSFGQDFAECICGEWGNRPTEDILRVTDALIRTGSIDESRMAIAGGSYGGYLVAWLATQTDRYRCAICHAGVFDLAGMYAGDITQGRARAFGGSPWEDREAMRRWDPSSFAERISTPMLVIHGEKDFRVPATQGLELYGILKARGIDARLVYYPDENHWILKRENSIHWYGEFLSWLHRYLG